MAAKAKTTDDLREQSKYLLYEIDMLYALLRYFKTREVDRAVAQLDYKGLPIRNAVIESYQLHARQLIEFLIDSPTPEKPTAPRFTRGKWRPPTERRDLQDLRDEFSERVMHWLEAFGAHRSGTDGVDPPDRSGDSARATSLPRAGRPGEALRGLCRDSAGCDRRRHTQARGLLRARRD